MALEPKYKEIQQFLSVPDEQFGLADVIKDNLSLESDYVVAEILGKILTFVYNFQMFKENKYFMNSVYKCIKETLELKLLNIEDFDELLIKNSLMRFIQEYIEYANISQKEQVLNFLADSFERLGLQPLIINLGLLLKPMYTDQDYIDKIKKMEEVEVEYELTDDLQMRIKQAIDSWLNHQEINLDKQEELQDRLKDEYDKLVDQHNLSKDTVSYKTLLTEVIEMLSLKLTMISLMESFDDDDLDPISIN